MVEPVVLDVMRIVLDDGVLVANPELVTGGSTGETDDDDEGRERVG